MSTDLLGPVMQAVLTCARDQLIADGRDVGLASLIPGGEVAWDNCDCDGQLYVRALQINPQGQQPNCPPTHNSVPLAVGVVRCAHTITDSGSFPTAAQMTEDTLNTTQDAFTLLSALVCCDISGIMKPPTIGAWTPFGALGGCAGGEWQFTVTLGTCDCGD